MKKRIITALLFIIITSALLFFYLLNEPAPTDKNFTGGEAITSRFIYVSGSQGWNQKVNYRNKYKNLIIKINSNSKYFYLIYK